jgi:hypothetical protein
MSNAQFKPGDMIAFTEDLSWHHATGVSVEKGQCGTVAWQYGQRLAIDVDGVFVHSVPVDCVVSQ